MSAKPTPGPWSWHRLVGEDGAPLRGHALVEYVAGCIAAGGGGDFYFVSAVLADGKAADVCHAGNGPTSKTNARLIAAAPDLADAVQALLFVTGEGVGAAACGNTADRIYPSRCGTDGVRCQRCIRVENALAALQKAGLRP